jgi:hypothetical protein
MMQISTKSPTSFGQRCHALSVAAYVVRQQATRSGGDFNAWRLSRLMREAEPTPRSTLPSVNTAFGCKPSQNEPVRSRR